MSKKTKIIIFIIIFIIIIIAMPIAIDLSYLYESFIPIATTFSSSDILNFYGIILSFLASTFLGFVALWQTKKANDMTKQANDISNRMLLLEEKSKIAIIDFLFTYDNNNSPIHMKPIPNTNNFELRVHIKNISDTLIKKCILKNAQLYSINNRYTIDLNNYIPSEEDRCFLPGDQYPYQFKLLLDNPDMQDSSENKSQIQANIDKNNKLLNDLCSCSKSNDSKLNSYYYTLYLDFEITTNYNNLYNESLYCAFIYAPKIYKPDIYFNMLNRIIRFND